MYDMEETLQKIEKHMDGRHMPILSIHEKLDCILISYKIFNLCEFLAMEDATTHN